MRLTIRHETRYVYGEPASSAIQSLRLTPRSHDGQFVRNWRIEVSADARLERRNDGYGNIVHTVFAEGPLSELLIVAEGDVDTEDTNGIVAGTSERHPPGLYLRTTPATELTTELAAFAHGSLIRQGGDRLAALHDMLTSMHGMMSFEPGSTCTSTKAGEAFARRAGVCQDFAHVFAAACRRIGVPARYVAGHYLRTDTYKQDAGHAWVEAYIEGTGWIGFDPANGICVCDRHVRVSIGCDTFGAAPVRGTRTGGGEETLLVAVKVSERPSTGAGRGIARAVAVQ